MAGVVSYSGKNNFWCNEMRRIVELNMPIEVEDGWMFTEPRLALPKALDDIDYKVTIGDGTNRKPTLVRINSKHSFFKGARVSKVDNWQKRKIENLFIVSYMQEPMLVYFD
jgi:hypothetical protein